MAQTTQWFHAIWSYMKKVKLSRSTGFLELQLVGRYIELDAKYMCLCACTKNPYKIFHGLLFSKQGASPEWIGGIQLRLLHTIPNSMQPLRDLSHLVIIFQKTWSHVSMVLFVAHHPYA